MNETARFIAEELESRIKKNANYSMRSFAAALNLSPGELSEIIRGKRRLRLKGALKIVKALNLTASESERFLKMVQDSEAASLGLKTPESTLSRKLVSEDLFNIVSDWYCFAILSLAETKGFQFETGLISKRLGISRLEAKLAIERLERVGLLTRAQGKIKVTSDYVISPDEVPSQAVRACHEAILEKAKTAIHAQTIEERELGGVTFAVHPKKIPELKRELKKFLDDFATRVGSDPSKNKTEVYQLETILFRLSEKGEET